MNEKHRRGSGLQPVRSKIVSFRSRGDDSLDESRKVVRGWAQPFVLGLYGRAFEIVGGELRDSIARFRDHAVAAKRGRNDDGLSHVVRMANRTLHRDSAAHAV